MAHGTPGGPETTHLEAGVQHKTAAVGRARHNGRVNKEAVLKVAKVGVCLVLVSSIVGVHKDVRACLALAVQAELALNLEAARATAGDHGALNPKALNKRLGLPRLVDDLLEQRRLFFPVPDVLQRALVALQAPQLQVGRVMHLVCGGGRLKQAVAADWGHKARGAKRKRLAAAPKNKLLQRRRMTGCSTTQNQGARIVPPGPPL